MFGAANAYLGLLIGMTISASIPAAVISMAIIRGLLRRNSILENNIVQTMTTAGEAISAGAIFTLPALFLWNINPSPYKISLIVLTGGFLGVLFMIPLRCDMVKDLGHEQKKHVRLGLHMPLLINYLAAGIQSVSLGSSTDGALLK